MGTLKTLKTEQQKSKKRAKRPKRPKKHALPETMETFKALTREEMPWLRLKYLKTLMTEQPKRQKRAKRAIRAKKQTLPETLKTLETLKREEILTQNTLPENWSTWENTMEQRAHCESPILLRHCFHQKVRREVYENDDWISEKKLSAQIVEKADWNDSTNHRHRKEVSESPDGYRWPNG